MQANEDANREAADFLGGGGEMGARMRALDWTATPLGPPASWPQSLKTIVRMMLDSRYAMWMLWGPELTFFCNDAYLPTVGIKRDWVLGARSDRVWEEIWPDIGPRIRKVLEHGQATWDEGLLLFLERSGYPEETYHTFSYSPVHDDADRIAGMLCVVTEVTERVIGERRLGVLRDLAARSVEAESVAESCRRIGEVLARSTLDVPFAALYLLEEGGLRARRTMTTGDRSDAVLPLVLEVGDAASWRLQELLTTEAAQELSQATVEAFDLHAHTWPERTKRALVLPLKSARHGLAGFLVAGASPRSLLDDRYRSFLGLVANQAGSAISVAQAYEAERQRAEALSELDRAKTAFFSNVSHEFRTPLTLMLGPLEELLGGPGIDAGAQERIRLIHRNAERLQRLVNTLLDFSRLEAGRVQASYEPLDLGALTRDLASTFRSAMDRAGIAFTVATQQLFDPVFVDREMWEKIILNLLSNAFKFTLAGSVAVRLFRDDTAAMLEVADTGVGIPAHELPRLFDRFHRVEGVEGRTHEGSGIGLALVQELVKLHGGSITVESHVGEGTRFLVRIPFGSKHLPAEHVKAPRRPTAASAVGARAFVQEALRWLPDSGERLMKATEGVVGAPQGETDRRFANTFGARVILADDNADLRSYLHELLSTHYDVQAVADGAEALALARERLPDLIVTDVMMPQLDGFGLLARIRADDALKGIAVILLSARAGEESRIEALDAGADDYITKPFSARELLARIGALLELRHMRRSAEAAFRLRTAQFETLLREAPLGVYLVDADLRIREANPTARAAFGAVAGLVGSEIEAVLRNLLPASSAEEVCTIFRNTLATGEPYFAQERMEQRLGSGDIRYYEWQVNRLPLPDGRNGVVCYFRDVSAHVLARRRLESADRQKDEFLAMLAHELRNPLAPIRSAGEVLAQVASLNPEALKAVGIVERQVRNLARLVDDLLDVSRITQGLVTLMHRTVRLPELIAQAVEIAEPLVREKQHSISVITYGTSWVNGDPARLVQCIANVVTNAAKYTDRGGTIRIECTESEGEAVLSVADNGVGIPKDLLPHIFELFVQSDRSLDRAQGGLGIGLSLVKRLIEMHGGKVSATSAGPGLGSVFELRLPIAERSDDHPEADIAVSSAPRRIAVVDDNQDAANSLAMILSLEGHRVHCYYSARDMINGMEAQAPEVAFLDIGLPETNGYQLAQWVRAHPVLSGVGLIALSGYGQEEDKERARRAGFDHHLTKPADLNGLRRVLGILCQAQSDAGGAPLRFTHHAPTDSPR